MNQPSQIEIDLSVSLAEAYKNDGMNRAILSQEAISKDWPDKALEMLKKFIVGHRGEFMTEDLRAWAYGQGFEKAKYDQAWGAVLKRAGKMGLIRFVHYGMTKNPSGHARPGAVWKAV